MIVQEQEILFKLVQNRFKHWSIRQVSGYVHGVNDGLWRSEPKRVYVRGYQKQKPYAIGYIAGFIDAYGGDAYFTEGIKELLQMHLDEPKRLNYRWWENA